MKVIAWHTKGRLGVASGLARNGHNNLGKIKYMAAVPAAGGDPVGTVITAALNIADWLCLGVIMFSGGIWMFGNRTEAIQRMIGGCSGYLIIRHATDIRDFLKGL
ncbi:hypothetical protein [Desulfotomaculum sp. 1211_IL3151]|uniref:hypothetical protein n=1 Tax=Desulfotomaculum sp. 1211_IL3151 TaxID=3084055 RepID=UPI002FDAC1F8